MSSAVHRTLRALGLARSPATSALARGLARLDEAWADIRTAVVCGPDNEGVARALRKLAPSAELHLFEPDRDRASVLTRGEARAARAIVHALALGDKARTATLYTPRLGVALLSECAALDPDSAHAALNRFRAAAPETEATSAPRETSCAVRPLDAMGLAPDLMIVSGPYDRAGLMLGALNTLLRHGPVILSDQWDSDLDNRLDDAAYSPAQERGGLWRTARTKDADA